MAQILLCLALYGFRYGDRTIGGGGGGGGGGGRGGKTIELWWRWWWWNAIKFLLENSATKKVK